MSLASPSTAIRDKASAALPPYAPPHLALALHEINTNLLRHTHNTVTYISISINKTHCIIRDNGRAFENFPHIWSQCQTGQQPIFEHCFIGLCLVRRFFPSASYKTYQGFNYFILPLGATACENPSFDLLVWQDLYNVSA